MPRIKPRIDSPLLTVFTGPYPYTVAYSLDDPSQQYREGFVSGITTEAHTDHVVIVTCPDCDSDRVIGGDHEFIAKAKGVATPANAVCQNCQHEFKVGPDGKVAKEWSDA